MKNTFAPLWALGALLMVSAPLSADTDAYEECLLLSIADADSNLTAGQMRADCTRKTGGISSTAVAPGKYQESALTERFHAEHAAENRDFTISTFKPTYIMVTYNDKFDAEDSIYAELDSQYEGLEQEEVKYQVSMKMPVWQDIFGTGNDLYAAYTQTSWWQLFAESGDISAPFRETNYEPELFVRHYSDMDLPFGGKVAALDLGFVHQSNGRSEPLSRSWNRLMGRVALDYGSLALLGRVWWRIPEDEEDDDNPAEWEYLGYGDITASWAPNKNTISAMVRPGTKGTGYELTWSYPISKNLRVFTEWFYGYGESLIDYDNKVNRFGIGVSINDWLVRPH